MEQPEASRIDIGAALQDGWELYRPNVGIFIGAAAIYFVIQLALGSVPFFGHLIYIFITGPVMGGFFLLTLDAEKNIPLDLRRFLDGFNSYWPLTLDAIVSSIFIAIPMMLAVLAIILSVGPAIFESISSNQLPDFNSQHLIFIGFSASAGLLLTLIVSSWYLFIYLIVIDQDVDFWESMEESRMVAFAQPFSALALLLVVGLINLAGVLAFLVGLLFSLPYSLCVIMAAYRQVFPATQSTDTQLSDGPEPANPTNLIP
jgi:hypothetical protein